MVTDIRRLELFTLISIVLILVCLCIVAHQNSELKSRVLQLEDECRELRANDAFLEILRVETLKDSK